jgi:hypothetical protein
MSKTILARDETTQIIHCPKVGCKHKEQSLNSWWAERQLVAHIINRHPTWPNQKPLSVYAQGVQ